MEITDEDAAALKLHPKYTVYEKIDLIRFEAEVEKALMKVRWERGNEDRNRSDHNIRPNTNKGKWFDHSNKTYDFRKMASTDLPFNSRIYLPGSINEPTEISMQMLKQKLNVIAERYAESSSNGVKNITVQQMRGIKSLKERRCNGEVVMYQTDKSTKMAIDTSVNYIRSMSTHVEKDEVISYQDNKDIEKVINAHITFWLRILQAGKETEDQYRIKMSMLSHNNDASCLYSLRKDHKDIPKDGSNNTGTPVSNNTDRTADNSTDQIPMPDVIDGPPVRPVCDISDGNSHKLSYLMSNLLKEVCYGDTVCNSTEEMLASIAECNNNKIDEDLVLGSADVKSLYPSLHIEDAVNVVCDELAQSTVRIEGIDYEEIGLYIAINTSQAELERMSISDVCPTKKHNARRPEITGSGVIFYTVKLQ